MKIVIEGMLFDTELADVHIMISYHDGHNLQTGDIYRSSKGNFYVYTPSQWSNGHRWELMSPIDILDKYGYMLEVGEYDQIAAYCEGWE